MYLDSLTTYHCIKYFCKTKINDHISKIVDYILNDEKEIYTKYTTIAWDMILCSTEAFILLINDNKLNTRIKDQITLSIIYTNIKGIVSKYNLEKEFNESLLAKASNFGFRS